MIGGKKIIHRAIALAATGRALGGCASFPATHITGRRPVARKSGGLLHMWGPVAPALIEGFAFRPLRDNA